MSRVNRDFEVSLAGWRPGNIGSLLYRQAIRRRLIYHPAAPNVKPPLGQGTVSGIFFAQPPRGLDFVLQLGGNLIEADLGGRSRGKPAVGVQRDAGRREVLKRSLDPGDDLIG